MRFLFFAACLAAGLAAHAQRPVHLIPNPVLVQIQTGQFALNKATVITYTKPESATVAALLANQLAAQTSFSLVSKPAKSTPANVIALVLNTSPDATLGREGYRLSSSPRGVVIAANQPAGLFYGTQTLLQLLPLERTQPTAAPPALLQVPAVQIMDRPRFGWRGVMLDVSRSFFTKEEVMRYIDQLAQFKINTLHWHLTDDNGWRIEIKSLPRLTSVGAWRVPRDGHYGDRPNPKPGEPATYGGFYTQDEIREVVRYAQDRHVTIVPEIDVPGHSMAMLAAYPELSCTKDTSIRVNPGTQFSEWYGNGTFKMLVDNTLNPSDEKVYAVLDKVFGEVAALFPGQYIHAGGDECYHGYWAKDAGCQALMQKEGMTKVEELQGYFMKRIEQIINAKGKKFLGWDEILEGGVSPSATVMSWRGMKGGIEAAKNGHDVVMTPSTFAYLDYMQSDPTLEPRIYASLRLKTCYSFEPVPAGVDSTRILGGQGNLWSEQAPTMSHIEYMTYPRAWALAEVFWTPRNRRDWAGFIPRLEAQMERAEHANINYSRAAYDPIVTTALADNKLTAMLDSELPGTDTYYSIDDTMPGRYSPRYTKPLLIPEGNVTLRVITYRNGKPAGRQLTLKRDELVKRAPK
ncbi:beta-N-acetylhexosaminidase [uncultured Fibrella sp.]|uniref:beta-N-acetylhexosaminidase n=1 Tax=uncultured Fibrella sp. TaxID=1284596 RepID=UPI0035CC0B15